MSKSRWIIAAAVIVLAIAGAALAEVEWEGSSWEDALARAKTQDQFVFVDFYTTWCGPCKKLDSVTYKDEKVIEFLGGTVALKYDAEKGVGEELAGKYRVVAYPTLIVFNSSGEEIDRFVGYLPPAEFIETIEGYTKGVGTTLFYEKKLADNPDDFELLYTLGMKYADAVRAEKAKATFARVMELDPDNAHGKRAEILLTLGDVSYDSEKFEDARSYYERMIEENPSGEVYEDGLRRLARAEYKLGNADKAVASYGRYVDLHPDDPKALNGFAWFCAKRGIGLDRALTLAKRGVELSNHDVGILDTLAEVYFARGEHDNAIKIAKEALEKDPEDQYLRDQVKRFEKARAEADAQVMR